MECEILPCDDSLWCLQRLFLPSTFDEQLNGKYALITPNNSKTYLCRIFLRKNLHKNFCMLSRAVEINECDNVKEKLNSFTRLSPEKINVIQRISHIKKISLSVIFKEPDDTEKWRNHLNDLTLFIKDILKLYVLADNSIIYLNEFLLAKRLQIYCIKVNTIGNIASGRVVDNTLVKIESILSFHTFEKTKESHELQIEGLTEAYNTLKNILICQGKFTLFMRKSHFAQILLVGPGGCGKKTLVNKVARDCGYSVLLVNSSELCRPKPGESEELLRSKFKKASLLARENEGRCILLLRNLEIICRKPSRLLSELLHLLDTIKEFPGVAVIATVEKPFLLNDALRTTSRFHTEVYLNFPSAEDRAIILRNLFKGLPLSQEFCSEISEMTPGFVISDLILLSNSVHRELGRIENSKSEEEMMRLMKKCISEVRGSTFHGIPEVLNLKSDLDLLGGLSDIKLSLLKVVTWPLKYGKAFKTLSIPQPSGVLLYGPPGCAKTSLVRAIASSQKITFLSASAADLYSSYVGETERTISQLFQRARAAAPSILFLDEIDAIVGSREGRERGAQERVLSSFLTEMDGIGIRIDMEPGIAQGKDSIPPCVVVIAATNRPNVLDSALLRPGRLDHLIYVPAPNVQDRLDILEKLTNKMPIGSDVNLREIAEKTVLFSGADLSNLCREAALRALQDEGMSVQQISMKHWAYALKELNPSLTTTQLNWYETFTFS